MNLSMNSVSEFEIKSKKKAKPGKAQLPEMEETGPENGMVTFAFSNDIDKAKNGRFMRYFTQTLNERGIRVVRFDFPFMTEKSSGNGNGKGGNTEIISDDMDALVATWRQVINEYRGTRLIIGGKGLGARAAATAAAKLEEEGFPVRGCVFLGFPFHEEDLPETTDLSPLDTIQTRCLLVQGERDPFGKRAFVESLKMSPHVRLYWMRDGEHNFYPRQDSGKTAKENWGEAAILLASFIRSL
ncbi:MAG: hypothetical protein HQ503_15635 [Rhodospirillales bacterium]|nr:hypothetical protein [Rhodospirillales bacterium]